jgi:hypothetical protein
MPVREQSVKNRMPQSMREVYLIIVLDESVYPDASPGKVRRTLATAHLKNQRLLCRAIVATVPMSSVSSFQRR